MTAAELVVRIQADIGDLSRKLVEAGAEVRAFGNETSRSTSSMKRSWRDAETGLLNFDRAQKNVRSGFNNGPFGLVGAIGDGIAAMLKFGEAVQNNVAQFGGWLQSINQGGAATTMLGGSLVTLAPILGVAGVAVGAFLISLAGLPILAGLGMFALTALADTVGTLAAIIYAAIGPVSTLFALLGLLGAGFMLAGQRAIKGGGIFKSFAADVAKVTGQFHDLIYTLGGRLLPIFDQLAGAASTALRYLGHLATLPLDQAFQSLAHKGARMLAQFLQGVGNVLANPIRLAIKFAFSASTAEGQVHSLLSTLGGYLFGKTYSVPLTAHRGAAHGASVMPQFQPGALQPILAWFNRMDFTKTGKRWGNEIVTGIQQSGILGRLGTWLLSVLGDAAKRGGIAFIRVLAWELMSGIPRLLTWMTNAFGAAVAAIASFAMRMLGRAWDWVKSKAQSVWQWIASNAASEFHTIVGHAEGLWTGFISHIQGNWRSFSSWVSSSLDSAWNAIKTKAESIWNSIISFIERPLTISINWPSPPGWLGSLLGGAGGLLGGITSGFSRLTNTASGGIFNRPTPRLIGEAGAEAVIPLTGGMGRHVLGSLGGGGGVTININNPTFMAGGRPAARELARILKPELDRIVTAR